MRRFSVLDAVAIPERWRVPAAPVLVSAGLVVGVLPGVPAVRVSPALVLLLVLPPLLHAAGAEIERPQLRRAWRQVTALSIGLVAVSAVAVAAVATSLLAVPWTSALVLGCVLASTDPVAVTAISRRLRLPPQVRTLVQAESLFNDATSLVLFTIVLGIVTGHHATAGSWAPNAVRLIGGGVAVGAVAAALMTRLRPRLDRPNVAAASNLVLPYVTYLAAQSIGGSGVTAVVVGAVALRVSAANATADRRTAAVADTVVVGLESVVFAIIGLQLPGLVRALPVGSPGWLLPSLALFALILTVRASWVFGSHVVRRTTPWADAALLSWAGTRGVVPMAAALSIPLTTRAGAPFPDRDLLVVVASGVIVLTLLVQATTLAPLVRRSLRTDADDGLAGTREPQA